MVSALLCLVLVAPAPAQLPKKPKEPPPTPEQQLFTALAEDDGKVVEELILKGADVNTRRAADGWTPLIYCVREDKLAMAAQLLRMRADPNLLSTDAYKSTPLLFALDKRKEALPWVRLLLENGADPNIGPGTKNYTPLMKAVTVGELELVQLLVEAGADVMAADPQGGTAHSRAVGLGDPAIIDLLARETQKHVVKERKPLRLNGRDHALLEAARVGNAQEVGELLASRETNPNAMNPEEGLTPLMLAVQGGHVAAARVLIDAGANVHQLSRDGQPRQVVFMALGARERLPALALLLEMGAEPNAKRPGDKAPLLLEAVRQGPLEAAQLLLTQGARLLDADAKGRTPLDLALAGEDEAMRKLFKKWAALEPDADLVANSGDAPNSFADVLLSEQALARLTGGESPGSTGDPALSGSGTPGLEQNRHRLELHLAVAKEDLDRVAALLADGADPNSHDRRGRTPLMTAADLCNAQLCRLLLANGANARALSRDDFKAPAIIYAASRREGATALEALLEAESPVDFRLAESGLSPLILAASLQNQRAVELLLAKGANPALTDAQGRTALDLAKATKNVAIMELLANAMAARSQNP